MTFHVLVDNMERLRVFHSLYANSKKYENYNFKFYTLKPSIYLYLKYYKSVPDIYLISTIGGINAINNTNLDRFEKDIHVITGRQSKAHSLYIEGAISSFLKEKVEVVNGDIAIVFNGCHTAGRCFKKFFVNKGAKSLTCEISNLPGKMIFDPLGVNAESVLYHRPEVLKKFKSGLMKSEQKSWYLKYEEYKKSQIPQANINSKHILFSALDSFLYFLKLGTKEETVSLFDKASLFIDKVKGKKHNFQLGVNHDLGVEYNFYPTQVTNDTQIHLNSNVNNLEALQIAIDDSNANGKKLFVKIHPAEQNVQTIRAYKDLELQQKLILVSNNTVDLIKSANKIFTINSTVGLEALIYQKDLTVLGRALYKNMTIDDVNDYIHGFLVDIDYFKTGEKFNSDIFDKLVKLANI